ncbi:MULTISPECIES: hypothetical protein [unclassified Flavonifractor]|uniref:hypothetical protein n=1 Tax=unclassified Flavonifractor TaxID=2629267 RepID=UPI000B38AA3D|nr:MULTISPECIES: hypothetical protein [unclassified Flavonifractor]OUN08450.1 hypothetical protein B5G42_14510 [Flavonifractor sp. An91]OUO07945.1 hypothetical protein B5F94_15605 [Flavonifractor sp. An4]
MVKTCVNGITRDMTPEEMEEFNRLQQEQPAPTTEPDRLTALELAVAELGVAMMTAMGGMSNG